jgi:hypothetical protein
VPEGSARAALDVRAILETLHSHRVRYVLIGGVAARLHGSPLLTEDLDVTPARDRQNLRRLVAALEELHAQLRVVGTEPIAFDLDERSFGSFTTMTLVTRHGFLDLCFRPEGREGYPDQFLTAVTFVF